MEALRHSNDPVQGCVLVIPSDLFRLVEEEARRLDMSLEAYILALVEREVRHTTERNLR